MRPYRTHRGTDVTIDLDAALAELGIALVACGADPDDPDDNELYVAIADAAQTFATHDPRVTDAERALQFCAQLHRATRVIADALLADVDRATWTLDVHAQQIARVCIERAVSDLLTIECFPPQY